MQFEPHPYAAHFPMMDAAAISRLAESIKRNGQREPIKLRKSDKLMIDGRNRLAACRIAKVTPETELVDLDELATLELIADLNIDRRHLTDGQKQVAAAEFAKLREAALVMRNVAHNSDGPKNRGRKESVAEAAEKFGVGVRTIESTRAAIEADPENAKKIASGEVSANAAAKAAKKISGGTKFEPAELEAAPIVDKDGKPVPENLKPIFETYNKTLQEIHTDAARIEKRLVETLDAFKHYKPLRLKTCLHGVRRGDKDALENQEVSHLKHGIRASMAHAVCQFCNGVDSAQCSIADPVTGKPVKPCDGRGWVEKENFERGRKLKVAK